MHTFEKHISLTEKLLFDYYLVSSKRENEIYSPFPFYLDKRIFDTMVNATKVLDNLVIRLMPRLLSDMENSLLRFDNFPLREKVIDSKAPLLPFYWVRYDAFERAEGGVFFSEFNYDKPCAQREIALSNLIAPIDNPSNSFISKFKQGFESLLKASNLQGPKQNIAILVDPYHYEEVHLAFLYMDLLKPFGYNLMIVGGNNLYVKEDNVYAFEEKIDVILRQFPTEFFYEINDIEEILRLFDAGRVLIINDPRAIIGQTKSLFAYFWELVEEKDPFLSAEEVQVIKDTIPHTAYFDKTSISKLIENKNMLVIKAAFGRYSQEVYIGTMCSMDEWLEVIDYVKKSEKLHVVQEFCPIKKELVYKFNHCNYTEKTAFGNFGIHLTNGEFSGICVRWSTDYLSHDETVWTSSVGTRDNSLKLYTPKLQNRFETFEEINNEAAFGFGYTGGYTGNFESFSTQALVLTTENFNELEVATQNMVDIFKKTTKLVQDNPKIMAPVLGISDNLLALITQNITDVLTFIGRFDWVYDTYGQLKLLEFNAETPAGLMEALALNDIIFDKLELNKHFKNPNLNLGKAIKQTFNKIVNDYTKVKSINNIGIVSSCYYEDWYNTTILLEQIKALPFNFILGEVSGLEVKEGKAYLNNVALDALYRYYPLGWFESDNYFSGIIAALQKETLSINPPSTQISQSKAFLALIFELLENGFYNEVESETINKYLPKTALSPKKLTTDDFCIKPYFGHEGHDIELGISKPFSPTLEDGFIYQERVDIQSVQLKIHATTASFTEPMFPIIGTYITGNSFAGVYSRAGSRITDKYSIYVPLLISE